MAKAAAFNRAKRRSPAPSGISTPISWHLAYVSRRSNRVRTTHLPISASIAADLISSMWARVIARPTSMLTPYWHGPW
jgi:hypothetical protein